ncbi:rRNA-processing protein UTP23 homolog [Uloborus diversus]|uniref:rRNA-processing protein UTP23 homolog n=1 Tax=Uloborus diversus TaxID=327109 RepID=UPI0024090735|nr:rRNA-processing protein UTP23 homolog [Uloborus diversus]
MKISRHRRVRRYLNFYKNNFQFRSPFQILIDATFCKEALQCKLNIKEQVPKYLEDPEVKLFTTPCVITEAELLGPKVFGAMLIVKQFKARKCGHEKNPICAADCLLSMVSDGNPDHYIIATQDREVTEKVRSMPGIPLMYVKYNAVILEKPSALNTETVEIKTQEKLKGSEHESAILKQLKTEVFGEQVVNKKKRKKIKGPNPLSCKKKKSKPIVQQEKVRNRKRHKRVKKNMSETT